MKLSERDINSIDSANSDNQNSTSHHNSQQTTSWDDGQTTASHSSKLTTGSPDILTTNSETNDSMTTSFYQTTENPNNITTTLYQSTENPDNPDNKTTDNNNNNNQTTTSQIDRTPDLEFTDNSSSNIPECLEDFYFDTNGSELCRPICGEYDPTPSSLHLIVISRASFILGVIASVLLFLIALIVQRDSQ